MPKETSDERFIRLFPDHTKAECCLCGETAARWVHEPGIDTYCLACDDYAEAIYTAQGGQ